MKLYAHKKQIQINLALAIVTALAAVPASAGEGELSVGPDVTIIRLEGVESYGNGSPCPPGYDGDCRGFTIGTDSCNVGTVPVDWCDETSGCRTTTDEEFHPIVATSSDHSVIAQNLYRLKDGRFEQIGMSFLKHGFVSVNSDDNGCAWNDDGTPNTSCVFPPAGGDQLGLGCTDFYGPGLNGFRPMGRRSEVQAAGANHPPDAAGGETNDSYDQRMVVEENDLDPTLNPGALYWAEGHYVVRDDARAGNGLNNASYRAINVSSNLNISFANEDTVREKPAIFAWQAVDPEVDIVAVDRVTAFTGEPADPPATGQTYPDYEVTERFYAARRVTKTAGPGFIYRYEYAIFNLNSDTSADGFTIEFPRKSNIGNVGFNDIDHHSGEPYDTSDWAIDVDGPNGRITWSAVDMGENTNALRWGTLFSFWFESDVAPFSMNHSLSLFKIDESLTVPFEVIPEEAIIFVDGFESGDTSNW